MPPFCCVHRSVPMLVVMETCRWLFHWNQFETTSSEQLWKCFPNESWCSQSQSSSGVSEGFGRSAFARQERYSFLPSGPWKCWQGPWKVSLRGRPTNSEEPFRDTIFLECQCYPVDGVWPGLWWTGGRVCIEAVKGRMMLFFHSQFGAARTSSKAPRMSYFPIWEISLRSLSPHI